MKLIEAEHNEQSMLRSIMFKNRELNLMELSVNTHDLSIFNTTCDDYLNSARTNRNKYVAQRNLLESQGAVST